MLIRQMKCIFSIALISLPETFLCITSQCLWKTQYQQDDFDFDLTLLSLKIYANIFVVFYRIINYMQKRLPDFMHILLLFPRPVI